MGFYEEATQWPDSCCCCQTTPIIQKQKRQPISSSQNVVETATTSPSGKFSNSMTTIRLSPTSFTHISVEKVENAPIEKRFSEECGVVVKKKFALSMILPSNFPAWYISVWKIWTDPSMLTQDNFPLFWELWELNFSDFADGDNGSVNNVWGTINFTPDAMSDLCPKDFRNPFFWHWLNKSAESSFHFPLDEVLVASNLRLGREYNLLWAPRVFGGTMGPDHTKLSTLARADFKNFKYHN